MSPDHAGPAPSPNGAVFDGVDPAVPGFVAALAAVAVPSADARSHDAKVAAAERVVAGVGRHRRAHVAALIEAVLGAEATARVAVGLAPRERCLFRGWITLPSLAGSPVEPATDRGTAAVDAAVADLATLVRDLVDVGGARETPTWERLASIGLASCFDAPAACRGGRDRRRLLLLLWAALRGRRPLVAAALGGCIASDRAWRARRGGTPGVPAPTGDERTEGRARDVGGSGDGA